ncbi:NAD(P)H-binding protein [Nonomuraea sp. FMUSA5-5]|uniref:NAD(P)H-binding protein n=1 Tax=Nonomuraea composti TaxID=2720023 RepID=A0ABX1B7K2_9ACTN|nr:NAD(P)H-binding protein [Nonomuraea sp. FMUSA5-5]
MRLFVLGASGGTGAQLVAQALDAGHHVTALVRDPAAIPGRDRLTVVHGDVLEPQGGWGREVAGHDAVLSCLGSAHRRPTTVYSQGMIGVIAAMRDGEVRRLACVTSAALALSPSAPLWRRLLIGGAVRPLYRHMYADMTRMEGIVRDSGLDWTIVRPPRLTDGALTGTYRISADGPLPRARALSRADLAHYLLGHLEDRATWRAIVELGGR